MTRNPHAIDISEVYAQAPDTGTDLVFDNSCPVFRFKLKTGQELLVSNTKTVPVLAHKHH